MFRLLPHFLVVAMAASQAFAQTSDVEFALPLEPASVIGQGARVFADAVEEDAGVEVEIVSPVAIDAMLEGLQSGELEFGAIPPEVLAQFDTNFYVFSLPFLHQDLESIEAFLWTPEAEALLESLQNKQIVGLTYWPVAPLAFFSNKPIHSVEDLQGIKVRVPGSSPAGDVFARLGANPMSLAWADVYNALQSGVVDGTVTSPAFAESAKLDETLGYASLVGHEFIGYVIVANEEYWDSLSEEEQLSFIHSLSSATAYLYDQVHDHVAQAASSLKQAGFRVTTPSMTIGSDWARSATPVWVDAGVDKKLIDIVMARTHGGGDPCVDDCRCINRTCSIDCCPRDQ